MEQGIAACSKHFLGYGGGAESPEKELMEEILLPHEAMIRIAGSKVVMTGYHSFHGIKAVANAELQQGILRDYLGFDGVMVSDYGSVGQIDSETDALHKAAAALNAGNDVEFQSGVNYPHLQEAIDKGLVSQETFEKAVKRVLTLKARLGLLDEQPVLYQKGNITFDTPEERETAYRLASQSVVLLKNDGILPLSAPKRIALTGPNANTMWAMLGDYTYQGMSMFWHRRNPSDQCPKIVSLKEGMEKFPEESYYLLSLINNYIYSNRNAEALEYLNTAISKDPNNAQLYDVMGRVYETGMKDYAKAEEYFKKALDMDGDNADILSNLGRVYYNQAVQQQTAANEITDQTQYQAELAKAKELFTKAMPYFEKAHQINPEARDVMTALRGIYYNLNMGDKFEAIEAEMNK